MPDIRLRPFLLILQLLCQLGCWAPGKALRNVLLKMHLP